MYLHGMAWQGDDLPSLAGAISLKEHRLKVRYCVHNIPTTNTYVGS